MNGVDVFIIPWTAPPGSHFYFIYDYFMVMVKFWITDVGDVDPDPLLEHVYGPVSQTD